MKILIVDDSASIRKVLGALFASNGHQVVGSLEDALGVIEAIRRQAPELICLDYRLPGQDGLSLLREIKQSTPDVDVLFMTATDDAGIEGLAADAGAAGFIRKPFSQQQILEEVLHVGKNRELSSRTRAPEAVDLRLDQVKPDTAIIVDDNGSVRLLMKALLEEMGIHVVQLIANGADAIVAAQTHQPAILCLDVEMPLMSGIEALPRIREASPNTAVVMITGNPSREFVEKAASLGAKGYILKPLRPAYVQGFIKKLLAAQP